MLSVRPTVSVVIAAYDMARWSLLERCIASALRQEWCAPVQVVLAVDNSPELYALARREFPGVDVVLHRGPRGASATRNAGARAATGEVLVFLDDDAEAHEGWLSALIAPLRDPGVVGSGGGVEPDWQDRAPTWFPHSFGWVVGASYEGLPTTEARVRNVWAENMAVRARDFDAVGGFAEGFGKVGQVSRPEDTEFCVRLNRSLQRARGWWHVPEALVRHRVPAERATLQFFLRRCVAEGRGKAAMAQLAGHDESTSEERRYVTHVLPRAVLRGLGEAARGDFWGAARSAVIVAGVGAAGLGWLRERSTLRRHVEPAPVTATWAEAA